MPYSLFLYNDNLNPTTEPNTYVMTRAWYRVVLTGNQAGYALELLVQTTKNKYPAAVEPLTRHQYVDDVVSGTSDPDLREEQINQITQVLALGGFKLKYVIKSGEEPPEGAFSDGESCRLLWYR